MFRVWFRLAKRARRALLLQRYQTIPPPKGIDRSPPQETTNDTVHGAGNNFPILDAPTTRSNRNFRSTGRGSSQRDEQDLSRCAPEKGLAAFSTESMVTWAPIHQKVRLLCGFGAMPEFLTCSSPHFFIVGIIRAQQGSEDSGLHRV
jgi:hypothetical protein